MPTHVMAKACRNVANVARLVVKRSEGDTTDENGGKGIALDKYLELSPDANMVTRASPSLEPS